MCVTYTFVVVYFGCVRVILKNDYLWRRRYKNYFQTRTPKNVSRNTKKSLWGLSQKINEEKLSSYQFDCSWDSNLGINYVSVP